MKRWAEKVALVTGASVGIGAEIARALAMEGMKVIAVARRIEKLQELAADVQRQKYNAKIYPIRCDVQKEEEILDAFKWTEKHLGGVDVLVNNAGIISYKSLTEENMDTLKQLLDVNVLAVAICSRELIQSVKKRKSSGHIINISSAVGHFAHLLPKSSLYPASKYAITGMAASLRDDLEREKLNVKVTNISPGIVRTDMATKFLDNIDFIPLESEDIAEMIIHTLSYPARVQIWDMIIMPFYKTA